MIFADTFTFYFLIAQNYIEMGGTGLIKESQVIEINP